jgi:membrane-associated phospholipid phosphatase
VIARRGLGRGGRAVVALVALPAVLAAQPVAAPVGAVRAAPSVVVPQTLVPAIAAALVLPLDARVTQWATAPAVADAPGMAALAATGRVAGGFGALAIGPAAWLVGEAARDQPIARAGARTGGAVLVALVATGAIKVAAGRLRPDASPTGTAHDWRWGGGLRGDARRSFPSGHASLATAAAVTLAHGVRGAGSGAWRDGVAVGAYALAGAAIVSRVRDKRHWLSDVLAGAALGSASALVARRW